MSKRTIQQNILSFFNKTPKVGDSELHGEKDEAPLRSSITQKGDHGTSKEITNESSSSTIVSNCTIWSNDKLPKTKKQNSVDHEVSIGILKNYPEYYLKRNLSLDDASKCHLLENH